MQSAILFGLSSTLQAVTQQVTTHCSSGSCQWKPFLSFGVCSSCSDITHLLINTTKNYTIDSPHSIQVVDFVQNNPATAVTIGEISTYGFPNGLHMDDDGGTDFNVSLVSLATSNRSNTVTFQNNQMLFWSLTMIRRTNSSSFTAAECGLFYCVKNYTSQVNNGIIIESSIPLPENETPNSRQPIDSSIPDPSPDSLDTIVEYARTDLQLSGKFNISQVAINAIGSGMTDVFVDASRNGTGANGYYLTASEGSADEYSPQSMQPIYKSSDLNSTFNILATSMTNNMRSNDDNGTFVNGSVGIVVYKIRWPWICLPFINLIGSGIFLAIVIQHTRTHNLHTWKSSSLAVLKYGGQIQGLLTDESYVDEMEKKANKVYVTFSESDSGKLQTTNTLIK